MYYIRIDSENANKIVYYCRHCGNEDPHIETLTISKVNLKKNENAYQHMVNPYTKFDPTLPRTDRILCPNEECATNKSDKVKREIIFIRYDDIQIKYINMCSTCDTVW
jgi:DNA-directed RNA polymerase subunit M/transcription elongation factor TFIIS